MARRCGQLTLHGVDNAELLSLLKVMVLLGDAPPDFTAKLSAEHKRLVEEGQQLRARLPSYLEQQRALLLVHCPLPAVLQPLVVTYAEPTREDMWDTRLRISAKQANKRIAEASTSPLAPLRRSFCLRQKRG